MTDEFSGFGGPTSGNDDLVEIDLNFESMRRFQAEFSPNLSRDGLFIDTGEPLDPGSVVRFRVILPEDFVFLEGTAVVEWRRSAEAVSDGPPGMALRFVTLSPQNEELVEQLVQDHIDAGGTPFDLVVRPPLEDFPTDALEGAPVKADEPAAEGYRLTVRGTGPSLESEALQALQDAVPGADEPADFTTEDETENDVAADVPLNFGEEQEDPADVRGGAPEVVAEIEPDDEAALDEPSGDAPVDDPPDIDWSAMEDVARDARSNSLPDDEAGPDAEPSLADEVTAPILAEPEGEAEGWAAEVSVADAVESLVDEVSAPAAAEPQAEQPEVHEPEPASDVPDYDSSITDVLDVPEEFASGPEVIDEIEEGFGSRAFEVSLPEPDDGPDTTPVMPDEGGANVTVSNDDGMAPQPRRRRLWPLGLGLILVLAVAAAFLRPYVKTWLETRGEAPPATASSMPAETVESQPETEPASEPERAAAEAPADEDAVQHAEDEPLIAENDPSEPPAEAVEPEPAPAARADAVESIEIEAGAGGTVVRIQGNGDLEDGAVSMENLTSPPRVLVRLRGIRSVFRPFTIEASTAEVTQARIGHHGDRRPPELWVVLDLAGPGAEIGGIDIQGDQVEFLISGP